jgi:acetyl-CoA/propionyl-CoA carboxylase biotin carboxyl carrier protein
VWIGPPPGATRAVGDKVSARRLATGAGVPIVPGTLDPVTDAAAVQVFGDEHGWPVAIKASGGGGGRGLKVARTADEAEAALESAVREAEAYFGSSEVYLERYLERPKHVEVQVLSPAPGSALWLGARDCSMQRRHQKLIEETAPPLHTDVVPAMGAAAVAVANACGYVNAGTVEFLVDEDGSFFFLEVNARLQVEHTITEEVTGLDLVDCQLRIASGDDLRLTQADFDPNGRHEPRGHAIECRINAEDPARDFAPGPGRITAYDEPAGPGVRVDSGFGAGDEVPGAYDSLVAKLIVHASTREEARQRMLRALREFRIEGIPTTIPAHVALLEDSEFVDGSYTTRTIESGALEALAPAEEADGEGVPVLLVGSSPVRLWNPGMAASAPHATAGADGSGSGTVTSPMHGTILQVDVKPGDRVERGDQVAVLEAMKMETRVAALREGEVTAVHVEAGQVVESGQAIAEIA